MARRTKLNGSCWIALSLAFVILSGCSDDRFGSQQPVTAQGHHTLGLWKGFFITAAVVGALVLGLIAYVLIRFRRRGVDIPSQRDANIPLEIVYTMTPILIVVVLFAFSVAVEHKVNRKVARPDLVVNVTGFQWGWQFEYPDQHVTITGTANTTPPQLVLPVGRTSRLVLRTEDVNHSLWVPQFLVKRDMIAGVDNAIDVKPDRVGTYEGKCAEYCSLDHWRMIFDVRVVPPEEFDQALADAQQVAAGR